MSKRTILLVDDNDIILSKLTHKINSELPNVDILTAKTYKEALKHILLNKDVKEIDAAVLDLNLPDSPHGNIVKYITGKNIPSVVFSGLINDRMKEVLFNNDIYDYVQKDGKRDVELVVNSLKRILKNYETNILVVDDSKTQLKIALNMIEDMHFKVTTAMDGQEAWDILEKGDKKFSMVLTDYNMPVMDGMELTLKIRERWDKDRLAIIVLSANDDEKVPTEFIKIGANDFIKKPYTNIEVKTRISSNLEILELFEKTRDMANKDFMTGAYNRRYFFDVGQKIFAKAKRENKDIAVAMFDIDKFKSINDTYGHDVGDVAIIEVAKILNESLRESDLVARFGGEEFCVILEDISLKDTKKLFEKIRKRFEENIIEVGEHRINYTTSIGVAYGLGEDLENMIKIADDGLYYCKNNGRNQVAINK